MAAFLSDRTYILQLSTMLCKKLKFGGLRIYFSISKKDSRNREKISSICRKAAKRSVTICEQCGKPGLLRTDRPRIKTLCDDCYN